MAPHGVIDGLFGLAAHVHLAAALPQNYLAFEMPGRYDESWLDMVSGLPDPIVRRWPHRSVGLPGTGGGVRR